MQVYFYTDIWKVAWFSFLQKSFPRIKLASGQIKIELSYKRRRTFGQDGKNCVAGFNFALFKSFVNVHSILDVLGPCSGRSGYRRQLLLTPNFRKCHFFIILNWWERPSPSRFHKLFAMDSVCCSSSRDGHRNSQVAPMRTE